MPQPEMPIPQHKVLQSELIIHFYSLIRLILILQSEVAPILQPDNPLLQAEITIPRPKELIPQFEVAPILQPDKPMLQPEVSFPLPLRC